MTPLVAPRLHWFRLLVLVSVLAAGSAAAATKDAPVAKSFDLPADNADVSLRKFAIQSGREVIFAAEATGGTQTRAVRGDFPPAEALALLLDGTSLRATQDSASGAFLINRAPPPNAPRAATVTTGVRPGPNSENNPGAITLTPFEVSGDKDQGYATHSTLSGTRTNEELKNVPSSISVLNRQFLDDIAATDMFKAVEFSLGAENTNQGGSGVSGDSSSGNGVLFRGIQNNWQSRDGFQWYVPSDTFNIDRVESNRGPTGQLYGDAAASGILNLGSKQARFGRNIERVDFRFDDLSSRRFAIDVNRQLTPDHAVRVNLLGSDLREWQDTAFDRRWGYAAATSHKFFDGRTTLRLNGERGEINRVQRTPLQLDLYSAYTPGTGSTLDLDPVQAGLQSPAGTQVIAAAGNVQRWTLIGGQLFNLESTGPATGGATGRYYRQSIAPAGAVATVPERLIPRTQQWNGPDNRADRDYHTITATLGHRFSENLFLEFAYNAQFQVGTNTNAANFGNLRRDVNPFHPAPSGTGEIANPNYDQLYVEHIRRRQQITNRVDNYRAAFVYDLKPSGTLARWIGQQRFVGAASYRDDRFTLLNTEEDLTAAAIAASGLTGVAAIFSNNAVIRRHYLRDGNGESLKLTGRPDTAFVSSTPNNTQATNPTLESYSLNIFGAFFGDRVRTSTGIRRDFFAQGNAGRFTDPVTGLTTLTRDAGGRILYTPLIKISNTALNYGAVWHVLPQASLFANYAESFQFNSSGTYFNGDRVLPRTGDGLDYGVRLSLLRDRLSLFATLFDNTAINGTTQATNQAVADEINALLDPVGRRFVAGNDTVNTNSQGYELELVANPTPNWTVRVGWSFYDRKNEAFVPRLQATLAEMKARATSPAQTALTEAFLVTRFNENPRTRKLPTLATRYNFRTGPLRGFFVGGSGFWREVPLGNLSESYIMANLLTGYTRRIGKVRWSAQLNVENLLDRQIRLSAVPTVSFLAPRAFVLTNSFEF